MSSILLGEIDQLNIFKRRLEKSQELENSYKEEALTLLYTIAYPDIDLAEPEKPPPPKEAPPEEKKGKKGEEEKVEAAPVKKDKDKKAPGRAKSAKTRKIPQDIVMPLIPGIEAQELEKKNLYMERALEHIYEIPYDEENGGEKMQEEFDAVEYEEIVKKFHYPEDDIRSNMGQSRAHSQMGS
jgi:hypothetical protein